MSDLDSADEVPLSSLGMQAIHTADRVVAGYELLFRADASNCASLSSADDHDRATAQVLGTTFGEFGRDELVGDHLLFLNATRSFFTGHLPLPIRPGNVVLELLETIDVDRGVLSGLLELKRRGFGIAIDDFAGEISRVPALRYADFVKIDREAVGERLPQLMSLVRKVNPRVAIVVERIETAEQFQFCCDLGAEFFQGFLLHRTKVLQRRTVAPSQVTCVQLVALLSDPAVDTETIVELLSTDPGLSLRVLKTVGSAAHRSCGGIASLRQAVVTLGRRALMDWVVLLLMAGPGAPAHASTWPAPSQAKS